MARKPIHLNGSDPLLDTPALDHLINIYSSLLLYKYQQRQVPYIINTTYCLIAMFLI